MITIFNSIAIVLYLSATVYVARYILQQHQRLPRKSMLLAVGACACALHLAGIISLMNTDQGLDFSLFKTLSLIAWFVTALCLISALRRPIENLLILLLPLSTAAILMTYIDTPQQPLSVASTGLVVHVISSILAYSVLAIAAFQAAALAVQEHQLKHRHIGGIVQALPPLQTMEHILFEIIWVGMVLLSVSIGTGAIYLEDIFAQHLVHKTTLSIVAWGIFAILLWGRHQMGWRSQTVVRWTLGGFTILVLGYTGSKLVLELILGR